MKANKKISVYMLLVLIISVFNGLQVTKTEAFFSDSYNYKFTVDEDGFTQVNITFTSSRAEGESWVFVPRFSPWRNFTLSGVIEWLEVVNTTQIKGVEDEYYFYQALKFGFASTSSFKMEIRFNMTGGALIIEPRGIFYSPQIGFDPFSLDGSKAEVLFPATFKVKSGLVASDSRKSTYKIASPNHVIFSLGSHIERLQIEFETAKTEPSLKPLNQSIFSFSVPERYESYAQDILSLYDAVYDNFTDLFNVTLESVNVQFFVPEFETLLEVGGFVPFTGKTLGEININIFFIRAVNGTIQTIALHELVHHFLWKAGLSPDNLLWFHEGAAQFFSVETTIDLGYPGATIEKGRLENNAKWFISRNGEDFGFIQSWTPTDQPDNVGAYYVASYYVVSRLAKEYGGLDFYKSFFSLIHGLKYEPGGWKPAEWLAFYLSMAANASVDIKLKQWGFDIDLVYTKTKISSDLAELIYEAEKAVDGLSLVFQPYKLIAEFLYQQALLRLMRGDVDGASQLLRAAITIANLAPLLTLLTLIAIFALLAYILLKRTSKPSSEIPPLPPTYQDTNI